MTGQVWFRDGVDQKALQAFGFRPTGGGTHQAMTTMTRELALLLEAGVEDLDAVRRHIVDENLLGKSTAAAKASALRHLRALYGLGADALISSALVRLWKLDAESRPLLAMLCALARDPLLRDSAEVVMPAPIGASVDAGQIADHLTATHPARFSPKMAGGISRNCGSSWTQSGHLAGRTKKVRVRAVGTPVSAAYAALLASQAGFGGPALIASPWMGVLDASSNERLSLLRRAEALGLLCLRAAGDVIEVNVDPLLSHAMGSLV